MTEDTDWRDAIHFLGGIFGPLLVVVGWLFLDARGLVLPLPATPATMVTFWVVISIMLCSLVRAGERREVFWGILNTWRRWLTALIFLWPGLLWVAVIDTLVSLLSPPLRWWFAPGSKPLSCEESQNRPFQLWFARKLVKARHWRSRLFGRAPAKLPGEKLLQRLGKQIEELEYVVSKLKYQLEVYQDDSLPQAPQVRERLRAEVTQAQGVIESYLTIKGKLVDAVTRPGVTTPELPLISRAHILQEESGGLAEEAQDYLQASTEAERELKYES